VNFLNGLLLENQSWLGVKKYLEKSKLIIIPIGSIENEGKHLPLGLDTHVAMYLCEGVSKKIGCMVGPCLPLGYSKWFLDFPGTISLEESTLTTLIKEYCECLYHHGFRNFIFINPHMGNGNAIADVGRDFRRKNCLVSMIDIWRTFEKIAKESKLTEKSTLTHAGEIGTSIALALYPEYVEMKHAEKTETTTPLSKNIKPVNTVGFSDYKGKNIWTYVQANEVTENGSIGNPVIASKEKGEILLEKMIAFLEEVIKELRKVE
jgi:creatinine amidohydrolase